MPSGEPARGAGASRHALQIDVTEVAGLGEPLHIGLELLLPATAPRLLFACVPGGGMNRRYFDLPRPDGEAETSFARAMLARGHAVLLVDPLGVGESSLPRDPYALHPDSNAAAIGAAVRHIGDGLRAGTLVDGVSPLGGLRAIGTGHSFGALLTIVAQAREPIFAAVALFGFHTGGQPGYVAEADRHLDAGEVRRRLCELARLRFADALMTLQAPPSTRAVSLASAMDRLPSTTSLMAITPDIVSPDAAAIAAPVLIALGEQDMHSDPHRTPAAYTASRDVTLLVLPDTRHNHFIYPSRTWLFERTARWAEAL